MQTARRWGAQRAAVDRLLAGLAKCARLLGVAAALQEPGAKASDPHLEIV